MRRLIPLVLLLATACGKKATGDKNAPGVGGGGAGGGTVSPVTAAPAVKVAAGALWQEYGDNESASDAKYKGKVVEVSGEIVGVSVSPGHYDVNYMSVYSPTMTHQPGVIARFTPASEGKLMKVKLGDVVTAVGLCKGKELSKYGNKGYRIELEGCEVVSVTTPPVPPAKGGTDKPLR